MEPRDPVTIIARNDPNTYHVVNPVLKGHLWDKEKRVLIRQVTS